MHQLKLQWTSVKKIINTSVDKSKLDTLFQKNLEESKQELKKLTHNILTFFKKTINYNQ